MLRINIIIKQINIIIKAVVITLIIVILLNNFFDFSHLRILYTYVSGIDFFFIALFVMRKKRVPYHTIKDSKTLKYTFTQQ